VRNWLSLAGVILIVSSWFAFFLLLTIDLFAREKNPYLGILTYLVAPMFFVLGLSIWVVGWVVQRRKIASAGAGAPPTRFVIDISRQKDRRILLGFAIGGAIFLLITSIGSYETYHATKTVQFCGQACHTPMDPQFVTYQNSPHARVSCTECHIGPGAKNFVKAKFGGIHQLFATIQNDFERPIHFGHRIEINQETCEQCHWPQRYIGDVDRTYTHFLADETNTQFSVRLLLKVGGGDPLHGPVGGIHWHMNLGNKVEYIATDPQKQNIPWVRFTDTNGVTTTYTTPEFKDEPVSPTVERMDCLDCHNRPAHQFQTPNDSVDLAMATGRIDPAIPLVKSNVVALLVQPYASREEAQQKIPAALQRLYPGDARIGTVVTEAQRIYQLGFFPEMKTDWRAYPNNIGHKEWAGCFRCHDGKHTSTDGKKTISASDCNSCHTILAQGNSEEMTKLNSKGLAFYHIDAEYTDFSCNNCHTGAFPK
jgi:nitrate/TMAO reductase-like tetraheme cytochrome c subunit